MRISNSKSAALIMVAGFLGLAYGQAAPPTILTIDIENIVEYQADISDVSKFATTPNVTPSVNFRDFSVATVLGDIVAVNGQPVKGLYAARARAIGTSLSAVAGGNFAIGDVQHAAIREEMYEILESDGLPIGTIVASGLSGGPAPPGAPSTQTIGNLAVVGGTGAFLGVRGVAGSGPGQQGAPPPRAASIAEDPANRRINGGGMNRRLVTIIPMSAPQILTTPDGPAVTHSSDFSLVTASRPATAGEILSLFSTSLGPTRPNVDPGKPFSSSPLAVVNSPVQVTVNGKAAEVLGAVGLPGAVDEYQINFRVPTDTGKGMAAIQVSAAWIAGAPVTVAVQ